MERGRAVIAPYELQIPVRDGGAAGGSGWRADVGIGPYGEERSAFVIVGATCVSPVAQ